MNKKNGDDMAENRKTLKIITPYIPFKTFSGFIDNLKTNTVPPIIDQSLLQSMSGSVRGQLLSSLKFLHLIDSNNSVLEALKNLVTSYKTDSWMETFNAILFESYQDVIGDVNLNSGTSQQLFDAFRKRGNVDGQMLDKAVRFYLSALGECSIKYSPYFKAKKARKPTQRKKKKDQKKKNDDGEAGYDFPEDEEIDDIQRAQFRIAVPGKKDVVIYLPDNIDQHDWDMVKTMLDAYVKRLTRIGGDS